ncbi:MAG: threonine ammonia-lyase, partial [Alphaproteobacteria bacterium]|nr:threonine ammonia-lyase [Alphaproteobacteria bacterium]
MTINPTITDIRAAADLIAGVVVRTPTVPASWLDQRHGTRTFLKLEIQQVTGSFKDRGAAVKLSSLDGEERKRGIIAMSAGNHAQGVAYHANRLGIPATIVMPAQTPFTKVERTRRRGAHIVLHGRNLSDCGERARELIEEHGYVLIHPYDDPAIIAGQETIGLELLADLPDLDAVIVPIGGGGVMAGVALAVKALKPEIRVFGVEAALYPSMHEAVNGLPPSSGGETIAEGIAVKAPGEMTRRVISELVEDIILVTESELESAIHRLAEEQKLEVEGAGAAGVAALEHLADRLAGKTVATVVCGGNIDSRMFASVLMRGMVRDGRLVRVRVEITDEPGLLVRISGMIGEHGGNIIEIYHHRLFQDVPVNLAELDAVIETRNAEHVLEILAALDAAGFKSRLLGRTEMDG